jgi:hypothetical protein
MDMDRQQWERARELWQAPNEKSGPMTYQPEIWRVKRTFATWSARWKFCERVGLTPALGMEIEMTELEAKLETILACLPDAPFKHMVHEVHTEVLNEIACRNATLEEWQKFAADVQPSDSAGADWLNGLRYRTSKLLPNFDVSVAAAKRRSDMSTTVPAAGPLDVIVDLLPCPFCGQTKPVRIYDSHEGDDADLSNQRMFSVVCDASSIRGKGPGGCGSQSGYDDSEEGAVRRWNVRFMPHNYRHERTKAATAD